MSSPRIHPQVLGCTCMWVDSLWSLHSQAATGTHSPDFSCGTAAGERQHHCIQATRVHREPPQAPWCTSQCAACWGRRQRILPSLYCAASQLFALTLPVCCHLCRHEPHSSHCSRSWFFCWWWALRRTSCDRARDRAAPRTWGWRLLLAWQHMRTLRCLLLQLQVHDTYIAAARAPHVALGLGLGPSSRLHTLNSAAHDITGEGC